MAREAMANAQGVLRAAEPEVLRQLHHDVKVHAAIGVAFAEDHQEGDEGRLVNTIHRCRPRPTATGSGGQGIIQGITDGKSNVLAAHRGEILVGSAILQPGCDDT